MKILAALGRSSRPLNLKNVRMIIPSSQQSLSTRMATSVGVEYLNAIINNNNVKLASEASLDKKFDSRLSQLLTSFDLVASRLPLTLAKGANATRSYYTKMKNSVGMHGIPVDVISRLTLIYGGDADRFLYYAIGATSSTRAYDALQQGQLDFLSNDGLDAIINTVEVANSNFSPAIDFNGKSDFVRSKIITVGAAHVSNLKNIVLSVLEDYAAGQDELMEAADQPDSIRGKLVNAILKEFVEYYKLMASKALEFSKSANSIGNLDVFASVDDDVTLFASFSEKEAVAYFNDKAKGPNGEEAFSVIDNLDIKRGSSEDGEYSSYGYKVISSFIDTISVKDFTKQTSRDLADVGIDPKAITLAVNQLYSIASRLSGASSIKTVMDDGVITAVQKLSAAIDRYQTLVTSLLGGTEDGARISVSEFMQSAEWNDSLGSIFYKFAVVGVNQKTTTVADKFNALSLSKDGYVGDFKAGDVKITVSKDELPLSGSLNGSNARVAISKMPNPLELRDSKSNETSSNIIPMDHAAGLDPLQWITKDISDHIGGLSEFILRGSLKHLSGNTVAVADDLLRIELVNALSDSTKMRNIARNGTLSLARDFTISADARKAVLDTVGIIDAALCASIDTIGSVIMKASLLNLSPSLDFLKGLLDINSQRGDIAKLTSYYIPGSEEDDLAFSDFYKKIDSIIQSIYGVSLSHSLPSIQSDTSIFVTVPSGVDMSANDLLGAYNDVAGMFDGKKKFADARRRIMGMYDRYSILKKGENASLKMGASAFAVRWDNVVRTDSANVIIESSNTSFANIVSSSILMDKLKNGSVSSLVTRGPEQARMTGILPLSYLRNRSSRKLIDLGLDSDLMLTANMFKFVDANLIHGMTNKEKAVGKLLSLVTAGKDIQRYRATGPVVLEMAELDAVLNSTGVFSMIEPFNDIVRLPSINSSNFANIDLRTFYGSSGDDLLYNILDSIGIYPYSSLNYGAAQVLLTYNAIRQDDYKYPFRNRLSLDKLEYGQEYTFTDLLDVNQDMLRSEGGKITGHFSCSVFIWSDLNKQANSGVDVIDVAEKRPLVVADSDVLDLTEVEGNIELCMEAEVDLSFGYRLSSGLSEQMLLGMAAKIESLF